MFRRGGIEPIDFLVVGHLSVDPKSDSAHLGGTAAYSALTAHVLGRRTGLVTSVRDETLLEPLRDIAIVNFPSSENTTFMQTDHPDGNRQTLLSQADDLESYQIPELWSHPPIVHLAPLIHEIPISMGRQFGESFVGMTPAGWLRTWDETGRMAAEPWPEMDFALRFADAVVVSEQDIGGSAEVTAEMAAASQVLAVRHEHEGTSIYTMGEEHFIAAPKVDVVDTAGAEGVFAAAFFSSLHGTGDVLGAARFATQLAALSGSRKGLESVPTKDEIYDLSAEVF